MSSVKIATPPQVSLVDLTRVCFLFVAVGVHGWEPFKVSASEAIHLWWSIHLPALISSVAITWGSSWHSWLQRWTMKLVKAQVLTLFLFPAASLILFLPLYIPSLDSRPWSVWWACLSRASVECFGIFGPPFPCIPGVPFPPLPLLYISHLCFHCK